MVSRVLSSMGAEVLRIREGRSIRYALRDGARGLADLPIYRVTEEGKIQSLGVLTPVRPEGFVMTRPPADPAKEPQGECSHTEGLPWWLMDMKPAGFLGRAYVARHAAALGLPPRLTEWSDIDALRALVAHGQDAVGNLLLGNWGRERFLTAAPPEALACAERGPRYVQLAAEAAQGESPGSSAGGEQPKFTAYAQTARGPKHVIVKFTLVHGAQDKLAQRWADLLLAEHHALETLRQGGVDAAISDVLDCQGQRFLEVERSDRVGPRGRLGLLSLTALDAEFAGLAPAPWPLVVAKLVAEGAVAPGASGQAALLFAFGECIGNTDMHGGNLSFKGAGRPYELAPAYDMLPMAFAPQSSGFIPNTLRAPIPRAEVPPQTWVRALILAENFLQRMQADARFSAAWQPCTDALTQHLEQIRTMVQQLE